VGGAASVVASLALAGCGSGAHYLTNQDENVFVKLPGGWSEVEVQSAGNTSGKKDSGGSASLPWRVVFDHADHPSPDHFDDSAPTEPVGRVIVAAVSPSFRDDVSLSVLRAFALGGADPLQYVDDPSVQVQVLGNTPDYEINGNHGNRIRFSFLPEPGANPVVLDQVAVMNPATTRVYVMQIKCEATCFADHVDEIEQIIHSFHIGGP
jgi:hypothetical protein